ncbi:MAG: AI-2E family transporter [Candidatus Eremiobacteraeota bacterium]|nr:AI-2E family transporter [Candidatus Eremiobacteraeota bacterium]
MRSSSRTPAREPHAPGRDQAASSQAAALPRLAVWFYGLGAVVLGWLILEKVVTYLVAAGTATATAVGALFVAYIMYPLVRRLNVRLPLWAAITIPYALFAAIIVLSVWLFAPRLVSDVESLVADYPRFDAAQRHYLEHPTDAAVARIPLSLRLRLAQTPSRTVAYVQHNVFGLSAWAVATAKSAISITILLIAIPVASIYMLAEAERMKRLFLGIIPERVRPKTVDILTDLNIAVGGYVRGQLIVAATVGILASTLLVGLNVPYGLLVGVWAGVADVLPYVGPLAGAIPAIALALHANGLANGVFVLIGFVIINQIEAHLLLPRIIAKTVHITPLTVIFALIIGGELFGLPGLLIAVPAVGAVRVIVEHLYPPEPLTNAEVRPALTQVARVDVDPNATHT